MQFVMYLKNHKLDEVVKDSFFIIE